MNEIQNAKLVRIFVDTDKENYDMVIILDHPSDCNIILDDIEENFDGDRKEWWKHQKELNAEDENSFYDSVCVFFSDFGDFAM